MRASRWVLPLALVLSLRGYAVTPLQIVPNTTLTAETGNNTSAAGTWTTSGNGNLGASNISKVDHRTLLYPGATTQIYTNIMYWFGPSNHMQVGYWSNDYNQVVKQVDDHLSRGITGTIVDWYGTAHTGDNGATLYLKQYAESLAGYPFKFAIMEDKGALSPCANTVGCDLNAYLVNDLKYIMNTYGSSPAYLRVGRQPAIFFFGLDRYAINWDWVKANVPGNPAFIFQNVGGYTHADSAGAFSWVMINTSNANDWEQSYLDYFYQQSLNYPAKHALGTAYKGFNDTVASWSLSRIMNQNCGQTWLNTWNEVGKYYDSTRQLESLQIASWNDYEEGTEIESGIDNCVGISAGMNGNTLAWSITGNENTLDHYTVFISTDGQNLMSLANVAAGIHGLDLSQFGFGPGNYTLYVKAVGKPSIVNHMSAAVNYAVANKPPVAVLSVTPTSGAAPLGVSASLSGSSDPDGSIAAYTIDFGDGTLATAATATHTYGSAGTYTVRGTVTDNLGASASASSTVTVTAPAPIAGVTISSPGNGATAASPVHFVASAVSNNSSHPITSMRIYVDSVSQYTVYANKLDTYISLSAGGHNVVIQAWDSAGTVYKSAVTINVSSVGVSVSSPLNGATVASPVHFVAAAAPNNPAYPITAMRIYVDGVSKYLVYANKLDTYVSLASGSHTGVVQAWDSLGTVYKTTVVITVK